MLWTQTLIPTMKETPEGAEIPSHVLMLRAGLINQVMAGAYTYLPLGLRALRKAEQIVREEMDAAGAVELLMPAMSPRRLWEQTGRVAAFGDVLIQFDVCRGRTARCTSPSGPTHEEVITDLVSRHISSYRQMPITLYQIQTKFRNEERPRFGVLRTSEFLMKDAYSFDASVEVAQPQLREDVRAYCRIFARCGLNYLPVEAESGPIGGDASHEFMVPAENGEDTRRPLRRRAATRPTRRRPRSAPRDCTPPERAAGSRSARSPRPAPAPSSRSASSSKCKPQRADQDADLRGRRPADRRAGPRRPRGQRGQDPPRREGRRSSNWPRPT